MTSYRSLSCLLDTFDLKNQSVFVRADLNVSLHDGTIIDDFRLKSITKTIDYIIKHHGFCILATHLGRPHGKEARYSTHQLLAWFVQRGYQTNFAETPDQAVIQAQQKKYPVILLENLRFFHGEQDNDNNFARILAASASYYVNDAWGLVHRDDTSMTLLPQFFDPDKRSIGFLIERELVSLDPLVHNIKKPYTLILGGVKIKTKLPLIENFLDRADYILVCPPLSFTFLAAQGYNVGNSLIEQESIPVAQHILKRAETSAAKLIMPIDYLVAYDKEMQKLSVVKAHAFKSHEFGVALGPDSIKQYGNCIANSKTIFFNGMMGFLEKPPTLQATKHIFEYLNKAAGYTVIAGGDTVTAAFQLRQTANINFLSTGGGSTLAYLAGKNLPGLDALTNRAKAE